MSDSKLLKKWIAWYPKEVFLKNIKNNKNIIFSYKKMKKEDFYLNSKQHDMHDEKNKQNELNIEFIKKQTYEKAFKKGFLEGQSQNNDILDQKLNSLCVSFEQNIDNFEDQLYSELLKIVLKISSYIIGKNIKIDNFILSNYIKKIINEYSSLLKKPKIIIHPDNKILVENTLKKFLNNNQWTLEYDSSIDVNGCKVISENSCLDATIDARWQELYHLMFLEEY